MRKGTGFALALLMLPVLSGCTWVPLSDAGAHVQLRSLEQARGCDRMSRVTVSVKNKIGGIALIPNQYVNQVISTIFQDW